MFRGIFQQPPNVSVGPKRLGQGERIKPNSGSSVPPALRGEPAGCALTHGCAALHARRVSSPEARESAPSRVTARTGASRGRLGRSSSALARGGEVRLVARSWCALTQQWSPDFEREAAGRLGWVKEPESTCPCDPPARDCLAGGETVNATSGTRLPVWAQPGCPAMPLPSSPRKGGETGQRSFLGIYTSWLFWNCSLGASPFLTSQRVRKALPKEAEKRNSKGFSTKANCDDGVSTDGCPTSCPVY